MGFSGTLPVGVMTGAMCGAHVGCLVALWQVYKFAKARRTIEAHSVTQASENGSSRLNDASSIRHANGAGRVLGG